VPVIMTTAYGYDEYRQIAAEAGASGYLVKPITRDILIQELERCYLEAKAT
jgi:CheY-like chemotaxis protein